MSIPFSQRCTNCNGTGRIFCPVCHGSAKASNERDRALGSECTYCRGESPEGTKKCSVCGGSGKKD